MAQQACGGPIVTTSQIPYPCTSSSSRDISSPRIADQDSATRMGDKVDATNSLILLQNWSNYFKWFQTSDVCHASAQQNLVDTMCVEAKAQRAVKVWGRLSYLAFSRRTQQA